MLDLTSDRDAYIVWGCLLAQIEDTHAVVWHLGEDSVRRAGELWESIPPDASPPDRVIRKALAYLISDIDHLLMDDEEVSAGAQLLAELDSRVDAMKEPDHA